MHEDAGSTAAPASTASTLLPVGAIASAAAAILHGAAAGVHAEHAGLSRIFLVFAVAQGAAAVLGFVSTGRTACSTMLAVNASAVAGWLVTRLTGISDISGLEVAERPGPADTIAAVLALAAAAAAMGCALGHRPTIRGRGLGSTAIIAGVLLVPGLVDATDHDHDVDAHADHAITDAAPTVDHDHAAPIVDAAPADDHDHGDDHGDDLDLDLDHDHHDGHEPATGASAWPRPWDPAAPIDFSGVPGVSAEQQARAEQLVVDTLRELPAFADVTSLAALGYHSIGDARTGFEHYINRDLINDDVFLDPTAPESLVYRVDGDARTLVSAMFIASARPVDDPTLTGFAGPLMQWHIHDNLCWGLDANGTPVVKGVLDDFGGTCPAGTVNAGGENPMVHVWIAPHECGPFAALEGEGAGQTSVSDEVRADMCRHDHGAGAVDDHSGHGEGAAAATVPYDPELPIDLGGVDGVTPQQQAFAENLVASTLVDLPKWADLAAVEAAGFHSIGDGATGHEHYIQWDWIDDDVWLDPDYPESLVFELQPDGTKKLVSAMYMLPGGTPLDEVPDWGGALMQWHVHGDLCFTADPVAPKVAGLKPLGTACAPPLVDGTMAPMIHVWIVPTKCGPFAALDGIAGGQVPDGEAILCDHAHGSA